MSYSDDVTAEIAYRVRLREANLSGRVVVFEVAPEITESGSVTYKNIEPVHAPGSILAYTNTPSRTWNISGIKLVSRTREDATRNLARINLIRSWRYPVFGQYTNSSGRVVPFDEPNENAFRMANADVLGMPPTVLYLTAYSRANNPGNIYKIPTVITSLSITWPTDVDYIPTADPSDLPDSSKLSHIKEGTPVPIIYNVDISLTETHAPQEYTKFSIAKFRNGDLRGF